MKSKASSDTTARPLSDSAVAWLLFLAVFAVYASTVCRTIYTGDDGDFASAVATFGIPHPTGYPLFILLGRLWITLTAFAGSVPFRLNLFTATCGAGAVAMLYRFLAELFNGFSWRRIWAIVGALVFAFSPTMWNQSNSCEVYAPNILFLGLLLWLSLRFVRTEPGDTANKLLCQLALVYGLALTNHLSIALFFPAFMIAVIWRKPSLFGKDWRVLLAVVGCLFLPLSLYMYLPLATKFSASPNKWGFPDTPERFWMHITGAQYRTLMFSSTDSWFVGARNYFVNMLPKEYGIFLLVVAVAGLVFLLRMPQTRVSALLLVAVFVGDIAYSAGYSITDIFVYYVPSYLVLAVSIAGAGILVVQLLEKRLGTPAMNRYAQLAFPTFLAAIAVHASLHYAEASKSDNSAEAQYAEGILASCPPNAIVAVRGSITMSLWYYQFVEKKRPDVLVISKDMFPAVVQVGGWYRWHLNNRDPRFDNYLPHGTVSDIGFSDGSILVSTFKNAIRDNRPIVTVPSPDFDKQIKEQEERLKASGQPMKIEYWLSTERMLSQNFDKVPWGLTERLYPKGTAPKPAEIVRETESLWSGDSPAIHADWDQLGALTGQDRMQTEMFFRIWESTAAWGKTAEAAHRPDLAIAGYQHALSIFDDTKTRQAMERLQQQVALPKNQPSP